MNKEIYLDNAATTYLKKEVLEKMEPYFLTNYGNPSSIHSFGQRAKTALDEARKTTADCLNANPNEIYFTGSGSEADNWAIKTMARSLLSKGNHIITSQIEHHAVLFAFKELEKEGFDVDYLPVDENGLINIKDLEEAILPETTFVSIMYANNEIGTIQAIDEIGKLLKEKKIVFHTDAVQAVGAIPIDLSKLHVDMMSISAHKFNGPKGVGALYVRKGIRLTSFIHGGAQERKKRAGTENVPGIIGLAEALKIATENLQEKTIKVQKLRDCLIDNILEQIPSTRLNGHRTKRLPGNVNISFSFIEGESLLLRLNAKGICASSGSACTSGSLDPSHVLLAIGLDHATAHGSLRLSLGESNTQEEIDYVIEVLPDIVKVLRMMSPLYKNNEK